MAALAVFVLGSVSLGRPGVVSASTGPNLTLTCPASVQVGSTFDCIAGWGAFTSGSAPGGYQVVVLYNSPAVPSGTPSQLGTAFTLNSIAKGYAATTMWETAPAAGDGTEFCPVNAINVASPLLPSGYVYSGASCVSLNPGGATLSPHDLLRFTFSAHAAGTFPVHMITHAQGGDTVGSYSLDSQVAGSTAQTNTYACAGATCLANAFATADNPTDPTITVTNGSVTDPATAFGGPSANPNVPYEAGADVGASAHSVARKNSGHAAEEKRLAAVNLATGNFNVERNDAFIPGKGPALSLSHSYNSQDTSTGPFGRGWQTNLNARLLFDNADHTIAHVTVVTEDGRHDLYVPLGGGAYQAPTGVFDFLTRLGPAETWTLRRKDRSVLHFDGSGVLQSITDQNGNTATISHDIAGRTSGAIDASGRSLTFTYGAGADSTHVTLMTDPAAHVTSYAYSPSGDLIAVTDPTGETTHYAYDASHRMLSITSPSGDIVLTNTYDGSGRVTSNTDHFGSAWTMNYSVPGQTTVSDPLGCASVFSTDALFRAMQRTDCVTGAISSYSYDAHGVVQSATDQLGHTAQFTSDVRGNTLSASDGLGHTAQYTYDGQDDLLSATDPLGHVTQYIYDSNGNVTVETDALGNSSHLTYDAAGELLTLQDVLLHTSSFAYDANGDATSATDPLEHTTGSSYDALGRLTSSTDALGNTTAYTYDTAGRLTLVADPLLHSSAITYDANGNVAVMTDALGHTTSYAYDAMQRPITETNTLGQQAHWGWDAASNLKSMTDTNGHTTTNQYDALGRLTGVTDPLGSSYLFQYDAAGNVVSRTDGQGQVTGYAYDAADRLTQIAYPAAPAVAYAYDASDRRLSMTDGTGTTSYAYDVLDRLTQVVSPGSSSVSYQHDAAGNRTSLTYPDGKQVTYSYDAADRPTGQTDWAARTTTYAYDAADRTTSEAFSNAITRAFSYDAASRPTGIAQPGGNLGYTFDNVGNTLTRTLGTTTETYSYDSLDRLTAVGYPEGDCQSYAYDAVGNRATKAVAAPCTAPPVTTTYAYDAANQLANEGVRPYTRGKNGNQDGKGNDQYVYDPENRLVAIHGQPPAPSGVGSTCVDMDNDGAISILDLSAMASSYLKLRGQTGFSFRADVDWDGAITILDLSREAQRYTKPCLGFQGTYAYNGDGLRISKTENGATTSYASDIEDGVVLQDSAGTTYEYGPGNTLILQEASGVPSWYLADGLGSATALTNAAGAVTTSYRYDVFGAIRGTTGAPPATFTFAGQQLDTSGNIYLEGGETYDPGTGRTTTLNASKSNNYRTTTLNASKSNSYRTTTLNASKSNSYRTTTVKGSKSNSDNRVAVPGGGGLLFLSTSVHSSKSNSSDRFAGAGGGGLLRLAVTVKGSKSNSDNRVAVPGGGGLLFLSTSVHSSKSNSSDRLAGSGGGPLYTSNLNLSKSNIN
jgi:YD repeat-containing protein